MNNVPLDTVLLAYNQAKRNNKSGLPNRSGHRNQYMKLLNAINRELNRGNNNRQNAGTQTRPLLQRQNAFNYRNGNKNAKISNYMSRVSNNKKNVRLAMLKNANVSNINNLISNFNKANAIENVLRQFNSEFPRNSIPMNTKTQIRNRIAKSQNVNSAKQVLNNFRASMQTNNGNLSNVALRRRLVSRKNLTNATINRIMKNYIAPIGMVNRKNRGVNLNAIVNKAMKNNRTALRNYYFKNNKSRSNIERLTNSQIANVKKLFNSNLELPKRPIANYIRNSGIVLAPSTTNKNTRKINNNKGMLNQYTQAAINAAKMGGSPAEIQEILNAATKISKNNNNNSQKLTIIKQAMANANAKEKAKSNVGNLMSLNNFLKKHGIRRAKNQIMKITVNNPNPNALLNAGLNGGVMGIGAGRIRNLTKTNAGKAKLRAIANNAARVSNLTVQQKVAFQTLRKSLNG